MIVAVLWLPFVLLSCWAVLRALLDVLLVRFRRMNLSLRAMDRLAANGLGWSGLYTISAEMGHMLNHPAGYAPWKIRLVSWVDRLLSRLDPEGPGHSKREAAKEGRD